MAGKPKKSWAEKVASGAPHQVKRLHVDIAGMKAGQMMLVPSARLIDAAIRAIPPGAFTDARGLRAQLAAAHGAEVCCPITTGILLRMVAEASLEAQARGTPDATPFWRVIDENAPIAGKLSCGRAFVARRRRDERAAA
ncbi:MAG: hypothetical protein U1E19_02600 [Rhodoblastus sp.]